jgi:outer membrane lipoprotein-sorting protein
MKHRINHLDNVILTLNPDNVGMKRKNLSVPIRKSVEIPRLPKRSGGQVRLPTSRDPQNDNHRGFFKNLIFFVAVTFSSVLAQQPTGKEIIDRVDKNISSSSRVITSKMVVHGERESRTFESRSWMEGEKKSFTEFLSPAREKGTKMLKLEDVLWMYSPSTDRTIQISGHLLRQSMMGSDLSYEDMMEDAKLLDHYDATVEGSETIDGRVCWKVSLVARTQDVAYHTRILFVDRENYVPLREELYAKSGKLLKRMEMKDVVRIEGRWYPRIMIFKDVLKTGEGTEFLVESIRFDEPIPPHIFSKASLKK